MQRNNNHTHTHGKKFGRQFEDKAWRKAQVTATGQDPVAEAESHKLQAEQKLLELTREAQEVEMAKRQAEAEAEAAAAPAPEPAQAQEPAEPAPGVNEGDA